MTPERARFAGRTALVTGASRGIGAAVAVRLAELGADVAIVARTLTPTAKIGGSLEATAARVKQARGACTVIVADLSDSDDRTRIVPEALAGLGSIDTLVNNAAAAIYEPPQTYPLRRRRTTMEVNYHAPIDLMQGVVPHMRSRGRGWIVNLTSTAARPVPGPPFRKISPDVGLYGASKAALERATNAFAVDLYGDGIRVNAVTPRAAVLTEGADALVGDQLTSKDLEPVEHMVDAVLALADCPMERTGRVYVSGDLLAEVGFER